MYKVIDGHKYDTDTAREQACYSYGEGARDFHHITEALYRTKTGLYFLYGEGGPLTKYAEATGNNSWSGGEKIIPMTEDAARAWTEEHCSGQTYERIFGDPEEGPLRQLNIKLSQADAERLEEIKKATGKSYKELVSGWIRSWQA